jgi:hypothetical protein
MKPHHQVHAAKFPEVRFSGRGSDIDCFIRIRCDDMSIVRVRRNPSAWSGTLDWK